MRELGGDSQEGSHGGEASPSSLLDSSQVLPGIVYAPTGEVTESLNRLHKLIGRGDESLHIHVVTRQARGEPLRRGAQRHLDSRWLRDQSARLPRGRAEALEHPRAHERGGEEQLRPQLPGDGEEPHDGEEHDRWRPPSILGKGGRVKVVSW